MPDPYYSDDHCTIYHGDCEDVLPELATVDLLLTDPPYGIGAGSNGNRGGKQDGNALCASRAYETTFDDVKPSDETLALCIDAARGAIVWGGNYFALTPSPCWLVWDKVNGNNGYADCELAWTNLKGAVRMKRHQWHGMLRKHRERRDHPTQKPLELMAWCIELAGDVQGVLDPFMGVGTTLRAAKDRNRIAIGIEREEQYCELAAQRLSQEVFDFQEAAS